MNPYATNKILYHPKIVQAIADGTTHLMNPTVVYLFPTYKCNHNCRWCTHRIDGWRNNISGKSFKEMDEKSMSSLIDDLDSCGVKAIEISGGGEPLAYSYIDVLLSSLSKTNMDTALITNGTLLNDDITDRLYATKLKWARVSFDAGTRDTYSKMRGVRGEEMDNAWLGVDALVRRRKGNIVGVSYMVSPENKDEIYQFCRNAQDSGVDNVRISVPMNPLGTGVLSSFDMQIVKDQIGQSMYLESDSFKIIDLVGVRYSGLGDKFQDLDYCYTKDVSCVIDSEGNIFTCCCLAPTDSGFLGKIENGLFHFVWMQSAQKRKEFNPRNSCIGPCIYREKNRQTLSILSPDLCRNYI